MPTLHDHAVALVTDALRELVQAFDPNQPRADDGRWKKGVQPEWKLPVEEWKDPPPPQGTPGQGKAGGYSSDESYGTNTAIGRVGEAAVTQLLGSDASIMHPPGRGEQSPLDVRWDGWGLEVKANSSKNIEYKATPKKYEIEDKKRAADELGVKPALAIVVIDGDTKDAHVYWREGLAGGRLSKNTGWKRMGFVAAADYLPTEEVP